MGNTQLKLQQTPKHDKSEAPPSEPDSDFTCEICIEPVRANNKFNSSTSCKCKHDFCSDCIAKYIESKVEFNVADIKCPALSCEFSLDPLSCRTILSNHLFIKWCDLLCNATVLNHYSNRFVYCPYRDCSALILNECKDKVKKCTCPNCKNEFCFQCKKPWHAGFRCREKGKFRDQNDVLVGKLIEAKKWTRCPKCGNAVERTGGCISVRCR
ncbi:hypothetical protein REPUB_Repub15cG0124800 [Reevesia pubescens]